MAGRRHVHEVVLMRSARAILWGTAIAGISFAIGACGLFETRKPTKPAPPTTGCRPLTSSPTIAVIPNVEDFYGRFEGLCGALLDNPRVAGYCYTQLTDVYQEHNGLYTFDRRPKFDLARLRRAQGL